MPDSTPATTEQVSELISVYTELKRYFENARDDFEQRIAAKEEQVDKFVQEAIQSFPLTRHGGDRNREISWQAPDGHTYILTIPPTPPSGGWTVTPDAGGKPVMALYQDPAGQGDAQLELSIDGAVSLCASLFHSEDDHPKVYATATDSGSGNSNHLQRPAFMITQPGVKDCPLAAWASFRVVCIKA
ncbi:MAG: hypothetical protein Q3M30_17395 [Candidatus Electrothrix sp. Rat3]|nr:hypothetical protein [Candidatus Electrothrix rattekaaiensis]